MELHEDIIVEIPPERVKFFGCAGKMLIPCPATVAALLLEIPEGKLITTAQLREELALRKYVQAVCPPSTQKALKAIAKDPVNKAPYWRIVKPDGELMAFLPGGVADQLQHLEDEGFDFLITEKTQKVLHIKRRLFHFHP